VTPVCNVKPAQQPAKRTLGQCDRPAGSALSPQIDTTLAYHLVALNTGPFESPLSGGARRRATCPASTRWQRQPTMTPSRHPPSVFVKLGKTKGYRLVGIQSRGFNAFLVRNGTGEDLLPKSQRKRLPGERPAALLDARDAGRDSGRQRGMGGGLGCSPRLRWRSLTTGVEGRVIFTSTGSSKCCN
jgi:hypothetical protein